MKTNVLRMVASIILCFMCSLSLWAGESREWTTQGGKKITAEYIAQNKTHFTVMLPNGKKVTSLKANLCDEDRLWLKNQQNDSALGPEGNKAISPALAKLRAQQEKLQEFFNKRPLDLNKLQGWLRNGLDVNIIVNDNNGESLLYELVWKGFLQGDNLNAMILAEELVNRGAKIKFKKIDPQFCSRVFWLNKEKFLRLMNLLLVAKEDLLRTPSFIDWVLSSNSYFSDDDYLGYLFSKGFNLNGKYAGTKKTIFCRFFELMGEEQIWQEMKMNRFLEQGVTFEALEQMDAKAVKSFFLTFLKGAQNSELKDRKGKAFNVLAFCLSKGCSVFEKLPLGDKDAKYPLQITNSPAIKAALLLEGAPLIHLGMKEEELLTQGLKILGPYLYLYLRKKNYDFTTSEGPLLLVKLLKESHLYTEYSVLRGIMEDHPDIVNADKAFPCLVAAYGTGSCLKKILVQSGCDPRSADEYGYSMFMYACRENNLDNVKMLLSQKSVDINAAAANGVTAVMYAASRGHLELLKYLVSQGADLKAKTKQGSSALSFALQRWPNRRSLTIEQKAEIVKYLVAKDSSTSVLEALGVAKRVPNPANSNVLFDAIKARALQELAALGESEISDCKRFGIHSFLKYAIDTRDMDFIRKVMKLGKIPLNGVIDDAGNTPLIYAASRGLIVWLKELLEQGADVNQPNTTHYHATALMYAVNNGQLEAVQFLLDNGADLYIEQYVSSREYKWGAPFVWAWMRVSKKKS